MVIAGVHDDQPVSSGEVAQDDAMLPLLNERDHAVVIEITSMEVDVRLVPKDTRQKRSPMLLHVNVRSAGHLCSATIELMRRHQIAADSNSAALDADALTKGVNQAIVLLAVH